MKKLKNLSLYNNIHFLVIPILLIGLSFKYYIFIILFILYMIYIIKNKIYVKLIIFISIFFSFVFIINNNYKSNIRDDFIGVIVDHNNDKYTIRTGLEYVIVYSKEEYRVGDKIKCSGEKEYIKKESYKNGFSYYDYLRSKKIYNVYYNPTISFIKHYHTLSELKYNIIKYYNNKLGSSTSSYVNTLVFGFNNIDDNISDGIKNIGISHLFSISGFHILLMYGALYFILSKIFKNEFIIYNIITIFLIFYIFFTSFSISILRSSLMLILSMLNKKYNKLYTSLDILAISIPIVLLINPGYLYQTGFVLTYLISFIIIIGANLCKSKNKVIGVYKINLLAFFTSLPIIININGSINMLSILLVPIFSYLVGYVLLPYVFLLLLFPVLKNIKLINLFELIVNKCNISLFVIRIPHINIYFILIYYILLFIILIMIENKSIRIYKIVNWL